VAAQKSPVRDLVALLLLEEQRALEALSDAVSSGRERTYVMLVFLFVYIGALF
jgi:hypothetical protein